MRVPFVLLLVAPLLPHAAAAQAPGSTVEYILDGAQLAPEIADQRLVFFSNHPHAVLGAVWTAYSDTLANVAAPIPEPLYTTAGGPVNDSHAMGIETLGDVSTWIELEVVDLPRRILNTKDWSPGGGTSSWAPTSTAPGSADKGEWTRARPMLFRSGALLYRSVAELTVNPLGDTGLDWDLGLVQGSLAPQGPQTPLSLPSSRTNAHAAASNGTLLVWIEFHGDGSEFGTVVTYDVPTGIYKELPIQASWVDIGTDYIVAQTPSAPDNGLEFFLADDGMPSGIATHFAGCDKVQFQRPILNSADSLAVAYAYPCGKLVMFDLGSGTSYAIDDIPEPRSALTGPGYDLSDSGGVVVYSKPGSNGDPANLFVYTP